MTIATLSQTFLARPVRERAAIFSAIVAIVLWGGLEAGISPIQKKTKAIQVRIEDIKTQQSALNAQKTALTHGMSPNESARTLQTQARALADSLQEQTAQLVQPGKAPELLETLLVRHPGVQPHSMRTLATEPVLVSESKAPLLYRHTLRVVVSGDYASLQQYVAEIETNKPRFLLDALNLDARDYPDLRLTLDLSTLSLEKTWLGF